MSKLVIVESPTKAKTLSGILGKEYDIQASMGHIRDLPKSGLSVDVEHDFEPEYEVPTKAKKVLSALKKAAKDTDTIILATDPDREGEAIAWHVQELLNGNSKKPKYKFSRVVFHELTKEAIEHAFTEEGSLDMHLVDAQQARRILDRLVGYKLSPLLWKKVRYGLSAGRVQSVAVRLIVERERERNAFKPDEYWVLKGLFSDVDNLRELEAELIEKNSKKLEVKTRDQAQKIEKELKDDSFAISEIKKSERNKKPNAPFKTSTLQQTMANTFGFTARRTMSAAQKLFEKGFITYHRTDSITLSPQYVNAARDYIGKEFGSEFMPEQGIFYKTKSKNAQEAHEAIRPTSVGKVPGEIKGLTGDELKVYSVIWKRSLECQMLPAIYDQTSIKIVSKKGYGFRASGSVVKFEGWMAVGKKLGIENGKDTLIELPEYAENEVVSMNKLISDQKFTQPLARYSDASLIKKMEEIGVGRPSTYAPTISTIQNRGYVEKDGRYFIPKDVAYVVTDLLVEHIPHVIDYDFTAGMEEDLDLIANGEKKWVPVIREFFTPFEKILEKKDKELHKTEITTLEKTDEKCPECKHNLVIKLGKYGKFLSCSNYPDCEYAKPLDDPNGEAEKDFGPCAECEDGHFVLKQGRFGKFLACSNYPKCKTTKPYLDKIGMKCPECGDGDVVRKKAKRREFFGCSNYPNCKWSSWKNPMGNKKDADLDNADEFSDGSSGDSE